MLVGVPPSYTGPAPHVFLKMQAASAAQHHWLWCRQFLCSSNHRCSIMVAAYVLAIKDAVQYMFAWLLVTQ